MAKKRLGFYPMTLMKHDTAHCARKPKAFAAAAEVDAMGPLHDNAADEVVHRACLKFQHDGVDG
ncbi:MAG: hypothetical protein B7Z37_29795 [Verrucomicrobia bacterium 12-59-8]|nr:MAG: hypothetical protein B7Z37_29795 [Verrucomicrobia bacterium 12-59-8]